MTKVQALEVFRADVLPWIADRCERDGVPDQPARAEAWNNWTDAMCKDGQITVRQYETWVMPDRLYTERARPVPCGSWGGL